MKPTALVALCLAPACAGTVTSDAPLYPADWPALVARGDPSAQDPCGTYRAVSEAAGPLEYPPGGAPYEMFFFVPIGRPPTPLLGRRTLAWHLASSMGPEEGELWQDLERFAAALQEAAAAPGGAQEVGWVRVASDGESAFVITCGVGAESACSFRLERRAERSWWQRLWSLPRGYARTKDGLSVVGAFPVPPEECPGSERRLAAGTFTFRRAVDGSLVMLENLHSAPMSNQLVFQKWWLWRPLAGGDAATGTRP